MRHDQILYIGDTEGVSGYAQSTRRTIFCLQDAGLNIRAKYVPHDNNRTVDIHALNRVRSIYTDSSHVVSIHHQIPHMFRPIPGTYNIGFTMFETTRLPSEWIKYCEKMDEIWVPSNFNRSVFIKSGITKPVNVVPFPLDTDMYVPSPLQKKDFRFVSTFQWTERKNWRCLLKAYFSEFTYADSTELYLKVYQASAAAYEKQIVAKQIEEVIAEVGNKNRPRYFLDFSIKPESDLIRLYQSSDVFVLPSKGESIGLGYIEAMACGIPCIATGWGGQTDFITENNGYLTSFVLQPVTGLPHIKEYRADQEWAETNIDSLKASMRESFREKEKRKLKGLESRKTIVEKYSTKSIAKIVTDRLENISYRGSRSTNPLSITYRGDAFGVSGYSNAIRLNIEALMRVGSNVSLLPVYHDRRQIEPGIIKDNLISFTKNVNRKEVLIDHQTPEFFDTNDSSYKYKIGITYFETSKIPKLWVDKCNQMNEIWLASSGNIEVFKNSGVTTKMRAITPFIDTDHFCPNKKRWNISNRSGFTFLSLFDFNMRKGWDVLVEAYAKAFSPTQDVCLILKTSRVHPPLSEKEIKTQIKNILTQKGITAWPKILINCNPVSYQLLPHLYSACDAFVLPTRGESICFPAMEAMACGKPVIITNCGGQTLFVNDKNGYLVDYTSVHVKNFDHSPWYSSDQKMAEPNLEHLILTMRHVFNNRDEIKRKGIQARNDIDKHNGIASGEKAILTALLDVKKLASL